MNLLICGDSFAADWTIKYPGEGWPNMMSKIHNVTNLAQAGCGEYKVLKQLESVDLLSFDKIIVAHTSPYRIHVDHHPIHHNDPLHKNCDLIYTDIKKHALLDPSLKPMIEYFEKYFDFEHAKYMHRLLCEKVTTILAPVTDKVIHVSVIDWEGLYEFPNMLNFSHLFKNKQGSLNHLDPTDNVLVFNKINKLL